MHCLESPYICYGAPRMYLEILGKIQRSVCDTIHHEQVFHLKSFSTDVTWLATVSSTYTLMASTHIDFFLGPRLHEISVFY